MSKKTKFMKSKAGKAWLICKIAEKDKAKSEKRRTYSINLMKAYKGLYDCKDCIHGLIDSCLDKLKNGCEYFSDEITGRRFECIAEMDRLAKQHMQEIGAECAGIE